MVTIISIIFDNISRALLKDKKTNPDSPLAGFPSAPESPVQCNRLTFSPCDAAATVPPDTRDSDARATSTTVEGTGAPTMPRASTSSWPTDVNAPRDSWESTARRKYPFAQKDTTPARTVDDASTTRPTTAASARSASQVLIVPQIWILATTICVR